MACYYLVCMSNDNGNFPRSRPWVMRQTWHRLLFAHWPVPPAALVDKLPIRHPPWALQAAEAEITRGILAAAAGIALPDQPPLLHYAHRQDVVAWWPARV
jgi:uncharacterized protein YqjF (DUF2071 family)